MVTNPHLPQRNPNRTPARVPQAGFGALSATTTALVARFSGSYGIDRQSYIDTFINSMTFGATSGSNVYSKIDALWWFAAPNTTDAVLNWKSTSFGAALVNSPTFTADRGYQPNGTNSYINTQFNPATAGGGFAQNSCHIAFWSKTNLQSGGIDMGARASTSSQQIVAQARASSDSTTVFRMNVDTAPATNATVTSSIGSFVITRTASNLTSYYKNGALVASYTDASGTVGSRNLYIGCNNLNGTAASFVSRLYAMASVGAGLSANEVADYFNAANAYRNAIGA